MNAVELKKQLKIVLDGRVEKLSASDINKLGAVLTEAAVTIQGIEISTKIEELQNSVSIEHSDFYNYFLDQTKLKKPDLNAKISDLQKYYDQLKVKYAEIGKLKVQYLKILNQVDRARQEKAIEILKKLKQNDKIMVSLLANLTRKTSHGVEKVQLGKTVSSIMDWYQELKNIKLLGVLSKE